MVNNPSRPGKKELEKYLRQSYELIKVKLPKKALRELGLD
jgi:predicted DNA-binding protein (MmcQ/YjbR family)